LPEEDDVKGFGPETFGELNADDYDATHDYSPEKSVEVLADLAGAGLFSNSP
jgi:hypothetical protein